ncbi:MAG: DUF3153 domain-containing protein, partial [Cyanobacteria bacterium P01_A01_bin.114]
DFGLLVEMCVHGNLTKGGPRGVDPDITRPNRALEKRKRKSPDRRGWGIRALLIVLALCLTGCIDYDVGIQFDSQTHGTITQTLHLSERLLTFNEASSEQWIRQFEADAKAVSASVRRIDPETVKVTLPFYNGADLVKKFNTLFGEAESSVLQDLPGAPQLTSSLSLEQQNRFLALRNHLVYDLDLRSLQGVSASDGGLISNLRVLNLSFRLMTPWGIQLDAAESGQVKPGVWQLQPGALNHIDVVFWVPSPIGIGAAAIALLIGLGYLLKYGPGRASES